MNFKKKILIVGGEESLRLSLVEQLEVEKEFAATQAETNDEALSYIENIEFDLFILDSKLYNIENNNFSKIVKYIGLKAPIICLVDNNLKIKSDSSSRAIKVLYKPIRFNELLINIRQLIIHYEQKKDLIININHYEFLPGSRKIRDTEYNTEIKLTDKETAIIKLLYRAKGAVVSKTTLLTEVWGYNSSVTTHTLETHIYRLRKKIELNPSEEEFLVTSSGGYKLIC